MEYQFFSLFVGKLRKTQDFVKELATLGKPFANFLQTLGKQLANLAILDELLQSLASYSRA